MFSFRNIEKYLPIFVTLKDIHASGKIFKFIKNSED